jgi:glycosyltransferase involved in cell wall biosynthesis
VLERVNGNGLLYIEDNPDDLAQQIMRLSSPYIRKRMGVNGSKKVRKQFSWVKIAQQRLQNYETALQVKNK